jgi:hypothetical protein
MTLRAKEAAGLTLSGAEAAARPRVVARMRDVLSPAESDET